MPTTAHPVPAPATAPDPSSTDRLLTQCRSALAKWMLWNDAYEESLASLYNSDRSLAEIQDHLDQLDALRETAKREAEAVLRVH